MKCFKKRSRDVVTGVDAVARDRGEPVCFLNADRNSLVPQFKEKLATYIHDGKLPFQSYCDSLHDGTMEGETLAHFVSVAKEKRQTKSTLEPLPCNSDLTSTLHLLFQTNKRYFSTTPASTEKSPNDVQGHDQARVTGTDWAAGPPLVHLLHEGHFQ